jgi:hypothetical protein
MPPLPGPGAELLPEQPHRQKSAAMAIVVRMRNRYGQSVFPGFMSPPYFLNAMIEGERDDITDGG